MKRFITAFAAALICAAAFAQTLSTQLVTWSTHVESTTEADTYRIVFTGKIAPGYHTYTLTDEFSATEFQDLAIEGGEFTGEPYELSNPVEETDEFGDPARHYYNEIVIAQDVKVTAGKAVVTGTIFTNACTGGACKAEYYDFEVTAAGAKQKTAFPWGLILQAILWGFAMLLTPCVFPMVPMTVSYFMKNGGKKQALFYGFSIVFIYALVGIVLSAIFGQDFANIISTHWLPNCLFAVIFIAFAFSLLGYFEIFQQLVILPQQAFLFFTQHPPCRFFIFRFG